MRDRAVSVRGAGFAGCFYEPETYHSAVLVVTGSDDGIRNAKKVAQAFAAKNIAALAVGYFGMRGLPRRLNEIPLEPIQDAADWLANQTSLSHVAMFGMSKGAEMALVCASLFSRINCVVASVPSHVVNEGFGRFNKGSGASSWTYRGKPLAFVPTAHDFWQRCVQAHTFRVANRYVWANADHEAVIPVENIQGRILLCSVKDDAIWPSAQAAAFIEERLSNNRFAFAHEHICYEKASHLLLPVRLARRLVFQKERRFPRACDATREDMFRRAVAWINQDGNAAE